MQASNGKMYGMATYGGSYNKGVVFSYDIPSNTYQVIHNFNVTAGSNPYSALIEGTDGKLYGMTLNGGIYSISDGRCGDFGVIFSLDTGTNNFQVLDYFNTGNVIAQRPFGSFIQASNGKLYSTTSGTSAGIYQIDNCSVYSGDNIFSLDISSNTYTNLYDFNYNFGGYQSMGSLMQASNGIFYGMAPYGGSNQMGVVFSLDSANNYTVLHNFYGYNGTEPFGNLIEMPQGTGITEINRSYPTLSAFPNPFSNSTTFTIKGNLVDNNAALNIYDITGREVRSIFIGNKREITFDRVQLESGMYFYKFLSSYKEILASGKLIIY
jgi:uncharacterized repeat protein (TIGR03803 family)